MTKQKTIDHVHYMYWTCSFLVLNSQFKEQSVVILSVNWCNNKCFWQRFTCIKSQIVPGKIFFYTPKKHEDTLKCLIKDQGQISAQGGNFSKNYNRTGPNTLNKHTGWIFLIVEQGRKVNLGQNSQLIIQRLINFQGLMRAHKMIFFSKRISQHDPSFGTSEYICNT